MKRISRMVAALTLALTIHVGVAAESAHALTLQSFFTQTQTITVFNTGNGNVFVFAPQIGIAPVLNFQFIRDSVVVQPS